MCYSSILQPLTQTRRDLSAVEHVSEGYTEDTSTLEGGGTGTTAPCAEFPT